MSRGVCSRPAGPRPVCSVCESREVIFTPAVRVRCILRAVVAVAARAARTVQPHRACPLRRRPLPWGCPSTQMATRSSNAETSACQYALQTILAEPLQLTCLRLSCAGLGAVRMEIPLGAECAPAAFAVKALRRNFRQQQLHRVKYLRVLWWSRGVA